MSRPESMVLETPPRVPRARGTEDMRLSAVQRAALAALLLLQVLGWHGHLIVGPDQAQYVLLGESLARGDGYRLIHRADAPVLTRWPPGLPALFAGAHLVAGRSFWAMNGIVVALGIAALFFAYRYFAPIVGSQAAAWVTVLTGINATFYAHAHETLSEVPYLAASLLALLAVRRAGGGPTGSWRWLLAAALATALAVHVRLIGILLVPAGCLGFLVGAGRLRLRLARALVYGTCVAVLLIPWLAYTSSVPAEERDYTYGDVLGRANGAPQGTRIVPAPTTAPTVEQPRYTFLDVLRLKSIYYTFDLADAYFLAIKAHRLHPFPHAFLLLVGLVVLVPILVGALTRWGRGERAVIVTYFGLYAAVLILFWPPSGARFFVPLVPFLMLLTWIGVRRLTQPLPPVGARLLRRGAAAAYVGANLAGIAYLLFVGDASSHRGTLVHAFDTDDRFLRTPYREFWLAAEWVERNSEPEDLAVARNGQMFFLATGRATLFPESARAQDGRADYVVTDNVPGPQHEMAVQEALRERAPPGWRRVARFGPSVVYRRVETAR